MRKLRMVMEDGVERQAMEDGIEMMVMLTDEIKAQLKPAPIEGGPPAEELMIVCKFFHPVAQERIYITHGRWNTILEDWELFGFSTNQHGSEWGFFALSEIEAVRVMGLPFERDRIWRPVKAAEVLSGRKY